MRMVPFYLARNVVGFAATAAVILFVAAAGEARADLVILGAAADNTLIEDAEGDVSSGGSTGMFVGRNNQPSNSRRRGVIQFDIAGGIPAGSTINSVMLGLSLSASNEANATVSLHRLLADWGEGTATSSGGQGAAAGAGDATWLFAQYNSSPWAAAGGDFDGAVSSQTVVGGSGDYFWPSTSAMVADVQGFLDDPLMNFGWIILGNESAGQTSKRFSTREDSDEALRPRLIVDYTPVPEPTSAALLISTALLSLGRRRRS